jgi:HD-GYP domain-containing protein (c-di-GMP phosphodiesterase class II)
MFCDVGMLPLQHLFDQKEPLGEDDREAIFEHPAAGAEMLPADFSPTARAVVRTHHENFDGSGYPLGMQGTDVHIFSRIVRVADAYDAATAPHIYRNAKSSARVLWEMSVGPYRRFYDPVLVKVFSRLIQPFPIGAKLRLSDGRFAVVVAYNRQDPFKPSVVIAFDTEGERLPNSGLVGPLMLADHPELSIGSFEGEDLAYLDDLDSLTSEAPAPEDFRTLFDAVYP